MPLVAADEASPRHLGVLRPLPRRGALRPVRARPLPSARAEADADAPSYDDPEDDRPTPVFDRSMTDTASLLRELSGLFHSRRPRAAEAVGAGPAVGPAPGARQEEEGPVRPRLSPGDDRRVRCVVQVAREASVSVDGQVVGALGGPGLVVLLGVTHTDGEAQAVRLAAKVHELRILAGRTVGGRDRRTAARGQPVHAVRRHRAKGAGRPGPPPPRARSPSRSSTRSWPRSGSAAPRWRPGVFGAHMQVSLVNDGPVTLILEV